MGERFLILEETADALDTIDPELARHFRIVNGLPGPSAETMLIGSHPDREATPLRLPTRHTVRMDEDEDGILVECSCGQWTTAVGWDQIDDLVVAARNHIGGANEPSGGELLVGTDADTGEDTSPRTVSGSVPGWQAS